MKRHILPVFLFACGFTYFFSSCNLIADTDCGDSYAPRENVGPSWTFTNNSASLPGEVYTYLENNQRYFVIRMYVDNLCAKEHVDVDYEVALTGVHSLPLDIVGTTSWNFLYEQ